MRARWKTSETAFAALVTAAFVVVAAFVAAHHEMWRDEMQAWLIARDSRSLAELFANVSHEGHPPLWHLVLFPLAHATRDPTSMKVLHVGIAAACVFLFARQAPFPRALRALFAFGYFPLYEYSAIARSYGLGLLFALAFCAAYPRRRARPLRAGLALALLACTSAPAFLLSCVLAAMLAFEAWRAPRGTGAWRGVGAAVLGLATSFAWLVPPPDTSFTPRLATTATPPFEVLSNAFAAVPDTSFFYWNENFFGKLASCPPLAPYVAALLFAWLCFVLAKDRLVLAAYAAATAVLLAFFWLAYLGDLRHHGFLFVAFLCAAWIAAVRRISPGRARLRTATLGAILACHVAGAGVALVQETRFTFSSGARAAAYLKAHGLERKLLVGEPDWAVETVLGYLGEGAAWSPRTKREGTFVVWTKERERDPSDEEVLAFAAHACRKEREDAVVVLNHPVKDEDAARFHATKDAELVDSVVPTENFVIYTIGAASCAAAEARR